MTRALLPLLALALSSGCLILSSGCLIGPVSDIPCTDDEQCPSDYFCDIVGSTCVAISEASGPPDLAITGIETPDGKTSLSAKVERETETNVFIVIENKGLSRAEEISLRLSRYHAIEIEVEDLPAAIEGGEKKKVRTTVFAHADSSTPVPFDWFMEFSGREKRGIFSIVPARQVQVEPD